MMKPNLEKPYVPHMTMPSMAMPNMAMPAANAPMPLPKPISPTNIYNVKYDEIKINMAPKVHAPVHTAAVAPGPAPTSAAAILVLFILLVIISRMTYLPRTKC